MRVVLTGASGQLGAYVADRLATTAHEAFAWSGRAKGTRGFLRLFPVDLTDAEALARALAEADPDVVLHAAAVSAADEVRRDPERGRLVNVEATARLADWCSRRDRRLVFTSTDLVFDGAKAWNREDDPAEPILAYGRTKREAERAVLEVPRGVVARVSLLFGRSRCGRESYVDRTLAALRRGEPQTFFDDEFRTPLDYATAAAILVRLAESSASGLVHVAGRERVSRAALVRRIAAAAGLDPALVRGNRQADVPAPEPRPRDVSLDTTRLEGLFPDLRRPSIEEAVAQLQVSP